MRVNFRLLFVWQFLVASAFAINPNRIEDNSFLLEEAYNQDAGEVQAVQTFRLDRASRDWVYQLTGEIPIPDARHQLSFDLPFQHGDDETGFGDIGLNYRYGLLQGDRLLVAPRASVYLPAGDYRRGLGRGAVGVGLGIAATYVVTDNFAAHANLYFRYFGAAHAPTGRTGATLAYGYAASLVYLTTKTVNFLVEFVGENDEQMTNAGAELTPHLYVSPGARLALNVSPTLQIVPGLGVPVGLGPSGGEIGILGYLSVEGGVW